MDLIKNSSDLSSGRRPISKSDEFSIRSILVLEITGREFDTFPKNVYTYWDFGSLKKEIKKEIAISRTAAFTLIKLLAVCAAVLLLYCIFRSGPAGISSEFAASYLRLRS